MIPLSFAQSRMWILHKLEGPSATYNVPIVLRLEGALDTAALAAAVTDVTDRHESLRTLVVENADGTAEQQVLPPHEADFAFSVVDVAADAVAAAQHEAACLPFDLDTELPLRTTVLRITPQEHVLVFVFHHIAADGSSVAPFVRDLVSAYTARLDGNAPNWQPLPVQYKDYTLWQRQVLGEEDDPESIVSAQLAYWKKELAEIPQPLELPLDRPRPASASHRGGEVAFQLSPELMKPAEQAGHRPRCHGAHGGPGRTDGAPEQAGRGSGRADRQSDRGTRGRAARRSHRVLRQHLGAARRSVGEPVLR